MSHIGYRSRHKKESERLVVLWSKSPWRKLDVPDQISQLGGAVMGETTVSGARITCLCLCIPYHMAKLDHEPVTRPWAHHIAFLELLTPWIREVCALIETPLIVAGDFNRRVPRTWGPIEAYNALENCFAPFEFATAGPLPPIQTQTIDHVVHHGDLRAIKSWLIDRHDARGKPRSDHDGVVVDFAFRKRSRKDA